MMRVLVTIVLAVTAIVKLAKAQNILEDNILSLKKTAFEGVISNNITEYAISNNTSPESIKLSNTTRKGGFSYLYAIEEDLLHQNWNENEEQCLHQLIKVIRNVQNSTVWATWIWDSMQFPVGQLYGSRNHLGNYEQCMNLPWKDHPEFRTQYCVAEIDLSELDTEVNNVDLLGSVQKYIRLKTQHGLRYNNLVWGICVPRVCKPESIIKFTNAMFRSTHLGQMEILNITVNPAYCQVAGEPEGLGLREYMVLSLVIILVLITLLSTYYVSVKGVQSASQRNKLSDFAKAFCLKSNAQSLVKADDEMIKSVLCIRLVLTFIAVTGHEWAGKTIVGIGNAGELDKNLDDYTQRVRFNIDMIVDTFFMISGLLLARSVLVKVKKLSPLKRIVKRYIRLICPVLLVMLILPIVMLHGDPAPLVKKKLQIEVDTCASNWWRTVLMIGNYGDTENMCYPILWSLPCDFHFFVIGVLICWIYNRNRRIGINVFTICAVASVIIPVIHGYMYNARAIIPFDFRFSDDIRKDVMTDPAYVRSDLRAGPYFLGLAIGYLMSVFPLEKHRNLLSMKYSVMAFLTFLVMFASLNFSCSIYFEHEYSPLAGALFSVMRRNMFAALIGFLIFICEYGNLPFINSVLSWPGFVFLSNLSYGVYLTHYMFILRFASRTRVPFRSDISDSILSSFGLMPVVNIMSLLFWLFWEAPTTKLFDMILNRVADRNRQIGNLKTNESRSTVLPENENHIDNKSEKKRS